MKETDGVSNTHSYLILSRPRRAPVVMSGGQQTRTARDVTHGCFSVSTKTSMQRQKSKKHMEGDVPPVKTHVCA